MENDSKKENQLLIQGKECYEKGMHKKALTLINEVIYLNPKNEEALFILGNIFYMQGQMSKGIKAFQRVLEINPDHTDACLALSILYNDIGKYEEAKNIFERANRKVKNRPNSLGPEDSHINKKFAQKHYELAGLYFSYNRYDEALFEYNKAITLNPGNLDCRVRIAKIYAKRGYILKAFEELKKLKNEYPDYLPGRVALGVLYFGNGNVIEAQGEWRKVLVKDPLHQEANMYLALSNKATETNIGGPQDDAKRPIIGL